MSRTPVSFIKLRYKQLNEYFVWMNNSSSPVSFCDEAWALDHWLTNTSSLAAPWARTLSQSSLTCCCCCCGCSRGSCSGCCCCCSHVPGLETKFETLCLFKFLKGMKINEWRERMMIKAPTQRNRPSGIVCCKSSPSAFQEHSCTLGSREATLAKLDAPSRNLGSSTLIGTSLLTCNQTFFQRNWI